MPWMHATRFRGRHSHATRSPCTRKPNHQWSSSIENTEDHQLNEHIWQFTLEQFIEAVKGSIVVWHTYVIRSEPANDAIDRRLRTPDTLQTPLAIHAMTSPRKCCQQPGYSIDTCACTCVHPSDHAATSDISKPSVAGWMSPFAYKLRVARRPCRRQRTTQQPSTLPTPAHTPN